MGPSRFRIFKEKGSSCDDGTDGSSTTSDADGAGEVFGLSIRAALRGAQPCRVGTDSVMTRMPATEVSC